MHLIHFYYNLPFSKCSTENLSLHVSILCWCFIISVKFRGWKPSYCCQHICHLLSEVWWRGFSIITLVHPVTFIVRHSLRAWSCPDCCPVSVLSSLSSYHLLPLIHLFPSFSILSSHSFTSDFHCLLRHQVLSCIFCPIIISHHNWSFHSSFPLFSLSDNEIGKFTPVT